MLSVRFNKNEIAIANLDTVWYADFNAVHSFNFSAPEQEAYIRFIKSHRRQ